MVSLNLYSVPRVLRSDNCPLRISIFLKQIYGIFSSEIGARCTLYDKIFVQARSSNKGLADPSVRGVAGAFLARGVFRAIS